MILILQGKQWPVATFKYCGSGIPIEHFSTNKKVYIRFVTNEAVEKTGFKLVAKALRSTCDFGILILSESIISFDKNIS